MSDTSSPLPASFNLSGTKVCEKCGHADFLDPTDLDSKRMIECRRYPPTATPLITPSQVRGAPPMVSQIAQFPNALKGAWCGEWKARLGS